MSMEANKAKATLHSGGLGRALDRFRLLARTVLGEQLASLVVFGPAAGEVDAAPVGGVEVMVVLRRIDAVILNQVRRVVIETRRELELQPLVLTPEELRRSTDVFPVKFQIMKWQHRLLDGEDLLSELEIDREHLRLRAEQEIKNLLFRLRRSYLDRAHRGELLETTLALGARSLLRDLATLLYLKTGEAPDDPEAVARASGGLGVPPEPVLEAWALGGASAAKPPPADMKALYDAFLSAVERAAELVDRHREDAS